MKVAFSTQLSVPSDVLLNKVGEETVLLNLESGRYFGLDEVGTRMWEALTDSGSIQAAYDLLLREYDVEAEALEKDLTDLVDQLVDKGLLETRGG
jgi:hypothetical protein